ncbi:MAG: hypothetical protein M3552_02990 [Planctomycetota bacterium]|nr:hypothetical protein [Planctomycetota bacterium]
MPRLFVGNFDFEHRLAYGAGSLPRRLDEINAALAPAWMAIAEPGDAVWTPSIATGNVLERLASHGLPQLWAVTNPVELRGPHQPVFWGENDWTVEFARRWELPWEGCDPAIVRRVNSRRFKHAVEHNLNVALEGAAVSHSTEDLANAVTELWNTPGWVLKGEFGGAGREVRFGGGEVSPLDIAWAANRYRRGLAVTVEPHLEGIEEAGLQFEVRRDGGIDFIGVTPLLTSSGGYLGSRFMEDESLLSTWGEAITVARNAASQVASAGYFGPLGIDAMRYRTADGQIGMRPIQDLNARYTMGRLALGLRRFPEYARKCGGVFRPRDFASR